MGPQRSPEHRSSTSRRLRRGPLVWVSLTGIVVAGVAAALILALGTAPPFSGTSDRLPGAASGMVSGTPDPSGEQWSEFLARLDGIAPWLVAEEPRTLTRARATCLELVQGVPETEVVSNAQERFTDVTRHQAGQIVTAVRAWCAKGS
ncbi:DUF732 domain-containing protein [Nonomuraea cavernae]|nr:DUF732 domain-containing protein [Nonomuraea cavernae]MCA2187683.1 DUF732 domain-containing protein [Nonomuraea cavernae]